MFSINTLNNWFSFCTIHSILKMSISKWRKTTEREISEKNGSRDGSLICKGSEVIKTQDNLRNPLLLCCLTLHHYWKKKKKFPLEIQLWTSFQNSELSKQSLNFFLFWSLLLSYLTPTDQRRFKTLKTLMFISSFISDFSER